MRLFFLFSFFVWVFSQGFLDTYAQVSIVSRAEWGADETLRYADSPSWSTKYPLYLNYLKNPKTQSQLDTIKTDNDRLEFLRAHGGLTAQTNSIVYTENGHPLIWPIQKVKQISRIVIHHSDTSFDKKDQTDEEIIRGIYRFHTLDREWGDIGYNYIIGQRGKIYEGRAGGDYVVASHASYNNMGTVGIVVLGDYSKDNLNRDQIAALEQLIPYLAQKYGITLSDQKQGVIKCDTALCYPFRTVTTASLLTHRDIGVTDCPGDNIYSQIPGWIKNLDKRYDPVLNPERENIQSRPSELTMNTTLKSPSPSSVSTPLRVPTVRYVGQKIRVKLSYPDTQNITLSRMGLSAGSIMIDTTKVALSANDLVRISLDGTRLSARIGNTVYTAQREIKMSDTIVRIDSWSRVPDWDKKSQYNDNLFRDTVRVRVQDNKLLVTNELPLEWYLKGVGEVSNNDLPEKIKTIIVAARSYAQYYMDPQNRKFSTSLYDASDDPDVFQKYLGYGYESRSPNATKIVDTTRSLVVTYGGKLIKPWYHSSSDGRTLSALEYCQSTGARNCIDIPYLQSVSDPGGVGHTRAGHGVGISGIGATYFATQGWTYQQIIQYYLKGVEISRK